MKILNAQQIRQLEQYTIENSGITSGDLMERAATAFDRHFRRTFPEKKLVVIFCGKGNNGGDGLAIARLMIARGCKVKVYVVEHKKEATPDFHKNLQKLQHIKYQVEYIFSEDQFPLVDSKAIVVDAILGNGLSRAVKDLLSSVIDKINALSNIKVAVDIATGLYTDGSNKESDPVVQVDKTFTFHAYKLAFLFPENEIFTGEISLLDIELDSGSEGLIECHNILVTKDWIAQRMPLRNRRKFAYKNQFGHALLIAGSENMAGAVALAAESTLRMGAGLLTVATSRNSRLPLQIRLPEAMTYTLGENFIESFPTEIHTFQAIGVGPGLGMEKLTAKAMEILLENRKSPILIDADGLNLIAANPHLKKKIPKGSVLTPHPGELRRLCASESKGIDLFNEAKAFAKEHEVYVLLKGAYTAICDPDGSVYFNNTGNPGMATAGSGDVLTGIILGLMAQSYPPLKAAVLGAYIHGAAGDFAAKEIGESSLIASDITKNLNKVLQEMHSNLEE